MKLHDLVPNPGSKKNRKRVGRGISAGQGKTAGRGTKGQGSRSGEGGKMYRQGGNLPLSPIAVHAVRIYPLNRLNSRG
jgi:large subunit ribosomal protein L15